MTSCSGSTCGDCNGAPPPKPVCGNGKCEAGETNASCAKDCPATSGHWCDSHCTNDKQPSGCFCDSQCAQYGDCCNADGSAPNKSAPNKSCAGSTCQACNGAGGTGGGGGATCGNGTCDAGETNASCPTDCPASGGGGGNTCTTYADVKPLLQTKCGKCHNISCPVGGKFLKLNAEVQSGAMPPGGGLSADDKAKIAAWAAAKYACSTAQCPP